jgi:hypothetical protein
VTVLLDANVLVALSRGSGDHGEPRGPGLSSADRRPCIDVPRLFAAAHFSRIDVPTLFAGDRRWHLVVPETGLWRPWTAHRRCQKQGRCIGAGG